MALNLTHSAFKAKQFNTDTESLLKSLKCVLLHGTICVFSVYTFQRNPQNPSDRLQPEHRRPAMRRHDIQINAHQSSAPPRETAASSFFFFFACVRMMATLWFPRMISGSLLLHFPFSFYPSPFFASCEDLWWGPTRLGPYCLHSLCQ